MKPKEKLIDAKNTTIPGIGEVPSAEVKKADQSEFLDKMFEEVLTSGTITGEVLIGPLRLVLRPLTTREYLEADTVYIATVVDIPKDIVNRVRVVSNLSYAIVSVNEQEITFSNGEEERKVRSHLNDLLMKLSPSAIDMINDKYMELVKQQAEIYSKAGELTENF